MNENESKTPRELPEAQRGVFVSRVSSAHRGEYQDELRDRLKTLHKHLSRDIKEQRWHDIAMWSVLVFFTAFALFMLGWAALGQGWAGAERLGLVRKPGAAARADANEVPAPPPVQPLTVRRPLDGMPVADDAAPTEYFAVMIDNLRAALPQSGVAAASLVIEAPVEGGITRLMAVFPSDADVAKIGPVRSARPYYLDWAAEFDALYAHVGGSPEALDKLRDSDLRDLNEFFNGSSFWRDRAKSAPHNVYTSTELLAKAIAARPRSGGPRPLAPWRFKDDAAPEELPGAAVTLDIGEAGKWHVRWTYDRGKNAWIRLLDGKPQADEGGSLVAAKNVVIQFVKAEVVDDIGRRRIDTVSGGDALFAADGRVVSATWKKDSKNGRTKFNDAAKNELSFNAGTTWIEVVPLDTPVTH